MNLNVELIDILPDFTKRAKNNHTKMKLGEKISSYRKDKGLSQELLAENAGVSLRTIQRIETNKSIPRPYTLKVIADALDVEIAALKTDESRESDLTVNDGILSKINLINSSALIGIIIPLFNILMPLFLWVRNKDNQLVNEAGKRIISFQVLWTFISILILYISHLLHYKITGEFIAGRVPFVLILYVVLLLVNVFLVIKNSSQLKERNMDIYPFIPNLF